MLYVQLFVIRIGRYAMFEANKSENGNLGLIT